MWGIATGTLAAGHSALLQWVDPLIGSSSAFDCFRVSRLHLLSYQLRHVNWSAKVSTKQITTTTNHNDGSILVTHLVTSIEAPRSSGTSAR